MARAGQGPFSLIRHVGRNSGRTQGHQAAVPDAAAQKDAALQNEQTGLLPSVHPPGASWEGLAAGAFAQRRDRPVALVTGATGGIGFFTAAGLAQRGWAVVVTGRDEGRGEEAVGQLRRRAGHDDVSFVAVDHSVVGENTGLAARIVREVGALDVVVNSVGGIYAERWESADGYEATLAINFVGPVALTLGLLPALRRTKGRCVNVVSSAFTRWLWATRSRICPTSAAMWGSTPMHGPNC
jgi:short chain dehydrogenase